MYSIIKRLVCALLIAVMCICTSGCSRILLGGRLLEMLGMDFSDSTDFFESSLELELPGDDKCTYNQLYSYDSPDGEHLSLHSVAFTDSEAEKLVLDQILKNDHWSPLPVPSVIESAVYDRLPEEHRSELSSVSEGYCFSAYSIRTDNGEEWIYSPDHDDADVSDAYTVLLGIYDSENHRLFYAKYNISEANG